MKTFTDLYPDTPEQNRIILTDETTGEQVSLKEVCKEFGVEALEFYKDFTS